MGVVIEAVYTGELLCEAVHAPSGETLVTEAPVDNGGQGRHFSPTDLVAAAFGTCALTIMGLFAQREGLALAGTKVRVEKTMTAAPPRRIARLDVVFTFPPALQPTPAQREKLAACIHACPVKHSLHPDTAVAVRYA